MTWRSGCHPVGFDHYCDPCLDQVLDKHRHCGYNRARNPLELQQFRLDGQN